MFLIWVSLETFDICWVTFFLTFRCCCSAAIECSLGWCALLQVISAYSIRSKNILPIYGTYLYGTCPPKHHACFRTKHISCVWLNPFVSSALCQFFLFKATTKIILLWFWNNKAKPKSPSFFFWSTTAWHHGARVALTVKTSTEE